MVTVDSMTSVHAGCLRDSSWRAYILHDCYNRRAARRGIELRRRRLTQRDSRDAGGPRARRPRHQLRADKLNCYMCSAASPPARLARRTAVPTGGLGAAPPSSKHGAQNSYTAARPTTGTGSIMFSGCPSVCACLRAYVRRYVP